MCCHVGKSVTLQRMLGIFKCYFKDDMDTLTVIGLISVTIFSALFLKLFLSYRHMKRTETGAKKSKSDILMTDNEAFTAGTNNDVSNFDNMRDKLFLANKIKQAFSDVPCPSANDIVSCKCDGCIKTEYKFGGLDWTKIDAKIIEENYDSLSLMTLQAIRYLLPVYMIYCLKYPVNELIPVHNYTYYSLTPHNELTDGLEFWHERFQHFTEAQRAVIFEFLHFLPNVDLSHKDEIDQIVPIMKKYINQIA